MKTLARVDKGLSPARVRRDVPVFDGLRWSDGEEAGPWTVRVERGRVVDESPARGSRAASVVLLDGLHNYHTHLGDAFLRGRRLPHSLAAVVRPGTGFKHRLLARAAPAAVARGIRVALGAHARAGTRSIVDFREQGVPGVRMLRDVAERDPPSPTVRIWGRPAREPPGEREVGDVLESADGIGLSSVSDLAEATLEAAARESRRARKPLGLHVSEQRREPIERVLRYEPSLLVHACAATARDLRRVADADVPVVVCPTSNAFFRLRSPLALLRRAGVRFFLGTDNAMLGGSDLLAEVRRARKWAPRVPDADFLRALTTPPEKAIKRTQPVPRNARGPEALVVLPLRGRRVQWAAPPRVVVR